MPAGCANGLTKSAGVKHFDNSMSCAFLPRTIQVAQNLCFLGTKCVFGERLFDRKMMGKSQYDVRSLTYCDLHKISRKDLFEVFENYPEFQDQFWMNLDLGFDLTVRKP